jgi:hypothetical protein
MPVIALVASATGYFGCSLATYFREGSTSQEFAFRSITKLLEDLVKSVEFVTHDKSQYRFWPRKTYEGLSYDGGICTYVVPLSATNSFRVVTHIFVKGNWQKAEDAVLSAIDFQDKLTKDTGLGIPAPIRRKLAKSSTHRRIVCGIELQEKPSTIGKSF